GWFPEWVIAGDGYHDGYFGSRFQDQREWNYAWLVSNQTRFPEATAQLCVQAQREVDPGTPIEDAPFGCGYYNLLRQLFTGIQVAGPRLGPTSVDRGYHAIPAVASTDPQVPACYYEVDDYTCVKDAVAEWWDSAAPAPADTVGRRTGCWRMPDQGLPYRASTW